ncbi:MAG: hypothetical protein KAF91_29645 [Nostoc sp. TH1S01]|nr:hypothetical protein [Nostoc sp. TH1S01]
MNYSMINNALKKVVGAATLITLTATIMPDAAQAQRVRYSGRSINGPIVDFDINTTVTEDTSSVGDANLGYFVGAIRDFNITEDNFSINNFAICGQDPCPLGDLTVRRLTTEADGNTISDLFVDGGSTITVESLGFLLPANNGIDFSNISNILRYDVSFPGGKDREQPDIVWLVQSNNSSLINNLTGLEEVNRIAGFFPRGASSGGTFAIGVQSSQSVPEPSTIAASLLSIGALGMRSLLQHRQRLKKQS